MATHSNILAWRIPWTEKPAGLQSMELQRVGHNWATDTYTVTFFIGEQSENVYIYILNSDLENLKTKSHLKLKNKITKNKNTLEINNRLDDTEECTRDL